MRDLELESAGDVRACLASFGDDVLFRGQSRRFTEENGAPSLPPSQVRQGCIPKLKMTWTGYAHDVVHALTGGAYEEDEVVAQALLQHYGWRSFFVDLTGSLSVAAWFASHRFEDDVVLSAGSDCHERSVTLLHQAAGFTPTLTAGTVYVIDRNRLTSRSIGLVDLVDQFPTDFPCRMSRQQAWLAGPLSRAMPPEAVLAQVSAPAEVLREVAAEDSLSDCVDLFPARDDDWFLRLLLAVPWQATGGGVYVRGLPLPEYDFSPVARHSESTAFFASAWIAGSEGITHTPLARATFYRGSPEMLHARGTAALRLPGVAKVLTQSGAVVLEADGLVRLAEEYNTSEYAKGVVATLCDDNRVEVAALVVGHPGSILSTWGVTHAWSYWIDEDAVWHRMEFQTDCACNKPYRHRQHVSALLALEDLLAAGADRQLEDGVWHLEGA